MPQDQMERKMLFLPKVTFSIPGRAEWENEEITSKWNDAVVWYTDGSLMRESAGAGIISQDVRLRKSVSLGSHTTVFQAEIFAIKEVADVCREEGMMNKKIVICSDSQAAIAAIANPIVKSHLVEEGKQSLHALSERNTVEIVWVPGHSGVIGNEEADELARQGAAEKATGPEPILPIPNCVVKGKVREEMDRRMTAHWRESPGMKHAKACMANPSPKYKKEILSLSRTGTRTVAALLTGHGSFKLHLSKIGVNVDTTLCRYCEEQEESGWHVLMDCPAIWRQRFEHLGCALGEGSNIKLNPRAVQAFGSAIGGL